MDFQERFEELKRRRAKLQGRKEAVDERRERLERALEEKGIVPSQVPAKLKELTVTVREIQSSLDLKLTTLEASLDG